MTLTANKANKTVKCIRVEKLFGRFTYQLPREGSKQEIDKILILYGDNGSGKTTILRLLFHLLATDRRKGHKTELAKIPFLRFEVELASGTKLWATREGFESIHGPYCVGIQELNETPKTYKLPFDEEGTVPADESAADPEVIAYFNKLDEIDLEVYLLSDDRTLHFDYDRRQDRHQHGRAYRRKDNLRGYLREDRPVIKLESLVIELLEDSMRRATRAVRDRHLRAYSKSDENVNTLYAKTIQQLVSPDMPKHFPEAYGKLCARVERIERKTEDYSAFGLMAPFKSVDFKDQLLTADAQQQVTITEILSPYMDSLEARTEAYEDIYRQVNTFVETLSSFIAPKRVNFNMQHGLSIETQDGEELTAGMLSSGERHLLLIFCNTFVALDEPSIFIIDEPEISLNIKWQARLITALTDVIGDSPVQYILATHSMEILAQHNESVVDLVSKAG